MYKYVLSSTVDLHINSSLKFNISYKQTVCFNKLPSYKLRKCREIFRLSDYLPGWVHDIVHLRIINMHILKLTYMYHLIGSFSSVWDYKIIKYGLNTDLLRLFYTNWIHVCGDNRPKLSVDGWSNISVMFAVFLEDRCISQILQCTGVAPIIHVLYYMLVKLMSVFSQYLD